ncbi:uncharacterized protein OCT59_019569 [Rhizophagus irregularis]|uniref:uncharacterized protein n=1 Tax=Rhizophagus irregularis TaxID=588596 RepID=UPI00331C60DE|nr:hypothetical protein OCT59_019569 [Rhizophagus irregularis]
MVFQFLSSKSQEMGLRYSTSEMKWATGILILGNEELKGLFSVFNLENEMVPDVKMMEMTGSGSLNNRNRNKPNARCLMMEFKMNQERIKRKGKGKRKGIDEMKGKRVKQKKRVNTREEKMKIKGKNERGRFGDSLDKLEFNISKVLLSFTLALDMIELEV